MLRSGSASKSARRICQGARGVACSRVSKPLASLNADTGAIQGMESRWRLREQPGLHGAGKFSLASSAILCLQSLTMRAALALNFRNQFLVTE